jgi:DNA excision repair protein ERCC-4
MSTHGFRRWEVKPMTEKPGLKILLDTREQKPYRFECFGAGVIESTLPCGDYSLPGFEDRVSIERKELNDLIACLMNGNRDRFERELAKLRFYDLAAVVVEASLDDVSKGRYKSEMKPHAALQSIFAFQIRYKIPFMFCGSRAGAEYTTFSLLSKYMEEIEKRYRTVFHKKTS